MDEAAKCVWEKRVDMAFNKDNFCRRFIDLISSQSEDWDDESHRMNVQVSFIIQNFTVSEISEDAG
ncbi:MAG: hypothetical protein WBM02_10290 [bacterium]